MINISVATGAAEAAASPRVPDAVTETRAFTSLPPAARYGFWNVSERNVVTALLQ
jgi:hypothetical protein